MGPSEKASRAGSWRKIPIVRAVGSPRLTVVVLALIALVCAAATVLPQAATFEDGVWTYKTDILYSVRQNRLKITVNLPPGAKVVSVEPKPALELEQEGRTTIRFQASRGMNEKFAYTIRYELPSGDAG